MSHGNIRRNHLLKADVHRVRVRDSRKLWTFTFSEMWGPLLTDEWGEPIDQKPLSWEEHPFWDAFEAWQKTLTASNSVGGSAPNPPQPIQEKGR